MAFRGWVVVEPQGRLSPDGSAATRARTYRLGWGYAAFIWAWTPVCIAAVIASLRSPVAHSVAERVGPAVGFVLFATATALLGAGIRRTRVTIDDSGIELVDLFWSRRLQLDDIRGYRTLRVVAGMMYVMLEPRLPGARRLRVPRLADHAFEAWLARIPDLGAVDRGARGAS